MQACTVVSFQLAVENGYRKLNTCAHPGQVCRVRYVSELVDGVRDRRLGSCKELGEETWQWTGVLLSWDTLG